MSVYINKVIKLATPNKYTKYYCNIITNALTRPQNREYLKSVLGYVESHHILPKCFKLGGEKDKDNLVFLTAKEHFIVHLCATKMFESSFKNKMIFAFRQLKSSNKYQERLVSSRLYAQIKPDFKSFVRVYKLDKVKYLYKNEIDKIEEFISKGWTCNKMTPEYKVGRCGNFKGLKHSKETKEKMSLSAPKTRISQRGVKPSKESIEKQKNTFQKNKKENPEKYKECAKKRGEIIRKKYINGELQSKRGVNNNMYGQTHTKESRHKISKAVSQSWKNLQKYPEKYEEKIKEMSRISKEVWSNPKLIERAKITGTTAYRKYKMLPQEFYDKKLKPLLYLGFLPTSMNKYGLLIMSGQTIKRLIYTLGTKEDQEQFEENKRKIAGANKSYIKFLDDQYKKYFI